MTTVFPVSVAWCATEFCSSQEEILEEEERFFKQIHT